MCVHVCVPVAASALALFSGSLGVGGAAKAGVGGDG